MCRGGPEKERGFNRCIISIILMVIISASREGSKAGGGERGEADGARKNETDGTRVESRDRLMMQ